MENDIIEIKQAEMLAGITRSEIDIQIATAKQYPRDLNTVLNKIATYATMDRETAEDCFYVLRRKDANGNDNTIEGLSIRMAEIIAGAWGNLRVQTRIIGNDGRKITAQAVCHDLETNFAVCKTVDRRITTKTGKTYSDDMQVVTGNAAASIAFRNAVLAVIPKAVTKRVINEVKQVALGQAIDAITLSKKYPNSAVIYGEMDKTERSQVITRFRAGEIRVIFNVRVLSTGFDYTGIDCIVLGVSTASIALYYQIIGRATRIDPEKTDALIVDLGGNVERFGRVEDITFEQGKLWRMFGTGGRLLSGIPISDIGHYTREDTRAIDARAEAPIEIMPFGKYKGNRISDIPLDYRQWMIRTFKWSSNNEKLRKSILATL